MPRMCAAIGVIASTFALAGDSSDPARAAEAWPFDALPVGTVRSQAGDLDRLVGDLATSMPGKDSGGYRDPDASEARRLRSGVRLAQQGSLSEAARELAPLGFRVVRYRDTATARALVVLAQGRAEWKDKRAWGLYALDAGGSRTAVGAPHTRADLRTERIAVAIFRRARAGALLVAGAHRYALGRPAGRPAPADGAHRAENAFHVVHVALRGRGLTTVVQPHGFDDGESASLDAIVSSGTRTAGTRARRVHSRLLAARLTSCLYRRPDCRDLGGTTNLQGRDTRANGGEFVHVELSRRVRDDAGVRDRAARAIAAALRR
jgi:hypothetical protein